MKRLAWLLMVVMVLSGCAMTQQQLEAEQAFYALQKEKQPEQRPLVDIEIADPDKPINIRRILVYAPLAEQKLLQYQHRDFTPMWVPAALNALAPLGILYGGSLFVKEIGKIQAGGSTTTYNQSVTGSGNTATVRTAGNTAVGGSVGNNSMVAGMIDQTSPPTVVNQPAPVVVTQPAPVIVEQPAPVIVQQSVTP